MLKKPTPCPLEVDPCVDESDKKVFRGIWARQRENFLGSLAVETAPKLGQKIARRISSSVCDKLKSALVDRVASYPKEG